MGLIRKNTKLLFILILPVYFYIIQNSILNKHTHIYANGLVITHSHILDYDDEGKPIKDHNHSQTEISLFSGLNIDLHIVTTQQTIEFKISDESENFMVADVQVKNTSSNFQIVPRGPPFRVL